MVITRYRIKGPRLKIAVVADLHGELTEELYAALRLEKPDCVAIPGDLCTIGEYKDHPIDPVKREKRLQTQKAAIEFLKTVGDIAPIYYSRGNHEWDVNDEYRDAVKSTGAVLLENEWVEHCPGVLIGGLTSAKRYGLEEVTEKSPKPDIEWLKQSTPNGYRVLLNHHPEYRELIEPYADLILCGHAHGGQARLFGCGLFAPGQGILPRYTKGQYGKMIVSAGLTNTTWVPRINNPTELVIVEVSP